MAINSEDRLKLKARWGRFAPLRARTQMDHPLSLRVGRRLPAFLRQVPPCPAMVAGLLRERDQGTALRP